jgi:hypothetical protein
VSGCGAAVHGRTVRMVKSTRVLFGDGVVVMGTVWVTTLHPQGLGNPELPPSARGCVAFVGGFLKDGVQRQQCIVHHSYEYVA